ncbi:MAG: hypothetical protein Q8R90_10385 [Bacteroidales bacterium]|nr:hypothetical protein [Bacteroidales bacterium]
MKIFIRSLYLLAFLPVLLLMEQSTAVPLSPSNGDHSPTLHLPLPGEPVPGAEIYVELEPDDEPIINSTTNEEGFLELIVPVNASETPPASVSPVINIWITFNEKIITSLSKNLKPFGKYTFSFTVISERLKTERRIIVDVKDNASLKSLSKTKHGPFKQTLNKISAEQFAATKGKVKVPVKVKLDLYSVNVYEINDDSVK